MKKEIRIFVALFLALIGLFILYAIDHAEFPDNEKVNELVSHADLIAYNRQGSNLGSAIDSDGSDNLYVTTAFDEREEDLSKVKYIVTIQAKNSYAKVRVEYPVNRTAEGKLLIGTSFHVTTIYVHTPAEYVIIFCISFIIFYEILKVFSVYNQKSNKKGETV